MTFEQLLLVTILIAVIHLSYMAVATRLRKLERRQQELDIKITNVIGSTNEALEYRDQKIQQLDDKLWAMTGDDDA